MRMHCVRYFLAVAETLNFTRAAQQCRVRQPSLTRAIRELEEELGGALLCRERSHTHLTELGRSMLPLLKRCHASALDAKALAERRLRGEQAPLRLAISHTVSMDLLAGHLMALNRKFPALEIGYLRGTAAEIVDRLEKGEAELAIAGPLGADRRRVHRLALFDEDFVLAVSECHPCAGQAIELSQLRDVPLMIRPYCENHPDIADLFGRAGIDPGKACHVRQDKDAIAFISAGLGACVIPESVGAGRGIRTVAVSGMKLKRSVCLYAPAATERTPAAAALTGLLCSADWKGARRRTFQNRTDRIASS